MIDWLTGQAPVMRILTPVNQNNTSSSPSLIALYTAAGINRITGLSTLTATLRANGLVAARAALRESGPPRHRKRKTYFTGLTGVTGSGDHSGRCEEHLAVTLRFAGPRRVSRIR